VAIPRLKLDGCYVAHSRVGLSSAALSGYPAAADDSLTVPSRFMRITLSESRPPLCGIMRHAP
jgi:hypothetical protein